MNYLLTDKHKALKVKVKEREISSSLEDIASEIPLNIYINNEHFVTLLCTPYMLKELAVGHLLCEGIIKSIDDIDDLSIDRNSIRIILEKGDFRSKSSEIARLVTTTCGASDDYIILLVRLDNPRISSDLVIDATKIIEMARKVNKNCPIFKKTGGTHAAAIFSSKGELFNIVEDVGRHNAIDRAVGHAALNRTEFRKKVLFSTGRMPADMVLKAARVNIPIIATISAPLSSGVKVAEKTGITLIGFVRGNRFNVYSHEYRVKCEE